MAKNNLRERLRRYVANLEHATSSRSPFPNGIRPLFMKPENGSHAASGHTQQMLFCGGKPSGLMDPYLLSGAEETERQAKLRAKLLGPAIIRSSAMTRTRCVSGCCCAILNEHSSSQTAGNSLRQQKSGYLRIGSFVKVPRENPRPRVGCATSTFYG